MFSYNLFVGDSIDRFKYKEEDTFIENNMYTHPEDIWDEQNND